jgi:ribosomal protein S18 acetylase RimI-like enzyme
MASGDDGQRLHEALAEASRRLASVMEGARFERRSTYTLCSFPTLPLPSFNGVWVDDETPAEEIAQALDELADVPTLLGIITRRKTEANVGAAASTLGYTAAERLPGMVTTAAELAEMPAPQLEVLRLATADGFAQALAVAAAGFDAPADLLAPIYMLEVTSLDGMTVYLGRVDGTDVTTAIHFVIGDAVGIFNVATPEEHRGRGYGAAITAQAVREGFAAGASFAFLQSSDLGQSVYRRLGFREVDTYTLYTRPASLTS